MSVKRTMQRRRIYLVWRSTQNERLRLSSRLQQHVASTSSNTTALPTYAAVINPVHVTRRLQRKCLFINFAVTTFRPLV